MSGSARPGRWTGSLFGRLLVAPVAIAPAAAAAAIIAGSVSGPPAFSEHLRQVGHVDEPAVLLHAEEAFRSAGLWSLAVGLGVAAVGAVALSLLAARRIGSTVERLADAAERVTAGDYDHAVPPPGIGRELDALASGFTTMAGRLREVEATRVRLLTDVSHEMRTPLATLDVLVEGIEEGVITPDQRTIGALHDQVARLARLASDLREVSAAEEGRLDLHRQPVDAAALVRDAVARFEARCSDAGVRLVGDGVTDGRWAAGDPARLGQVLDNLLANALRHTPAGGSVTVSIRGDRGDVLIAVRDTGEGIDEVDLPHVFERFYRADASRARRDGSGTGVGLAISRAIALAHDGSLTADSDGPGRGATFTLRLPARGPDLHQNSMVRRSQSDTGRPDWRA